MEEDIQVMIEELARVALGIVMGEQIGFVLYMSDEELLRVRDYLESKREEDNHE